MANQPLFSLDAFHPIPKGITHVCAAGESIPLKAHTRAFTQYIEDKSAGPAGRERQADQISRVRSLVARAWHVNAAEIGFVSNVAEGVSLILESLDWKPGDNVCVDAQDFPSLVALFALKGQSQQSRPHCMRMPEVRYGAADTLARIVDASTKIIAVSYVSYLNGARVDLGFYRAVADSVGALLLVDFTQAAGYMPIEAGVADFAFSAGYKWLLGITGTAIAYWNQSQQPDWRPTTAGWHSLASFPPRSSDAGSEGLQPQGEQGQEQVRRPDFQVRADALCFSRGNPAHLSIYILRECLEYLAQWEPRVIEAHVQSLTASLLDALEKEGICSSTPREKERHGGSVTVHCQGAAEIVQEIGEQGVYAWNGNGRVRFSFHGYNCQEDVTSIMRVFPGLWRKWNRAGERKWA